VFLPVDAFEADLSKEAGRDIKVADLADMGLKARACELLGHTAGLDGKDKQHFIKFREGTTGGFRESMRMELTLRREVKFGRDSCGIIIPALKKYLFARKLKMHKDKFSVDIHVDPKSKKPVEVPHKDDLLAEIKKSEPAVPIGPRQGDRVGDPHSSQSAALKRELERKPSEPWDEDFGGDSTFGFGARGPEPDSQRRRVSAGSSKGHESNSIESQVLVLEDSLNRALSNLATIESRDQGLRQRVINDLVSECSRVKKLSQGSTDRALLALTSTPHADMVKFDKLMKAVRDYGLELRIPRPQHQQKFLDRLHEVQQVPFLAKHLPFDILFACQGARASGHITNRLWDWSDRTRGIHVKREPLESPDMLPYCNWNCPLRLRFQSEVIIDINKRCLLASSITATQERWVPLQDFPEFLHGFNNHPQDARAHGVYDDALAESIVKVWRVQTLTPDPGFTMHLEAELIALTAVDCDRPADGMTYSECFISGCMRDSNVKSQAGPVVAAQKQMAEFKATQQAGIRENAFKAMPNLFMVSANFVDLCSDDRQNVEISVDTFNNIAKDATTKRIRLPWAQFRRMFQRLCEDFVKVPKSMEGYDIVLRQLKTACKRWEALLVVAAHAGVSLMCQTFQENGQWYLIWILVRWTLSVATSNNSSNCQT